MYAFREHTIWNKSMNIEDESKAINGHYILCTFLSTPHQNANYNQWMVWVDELKNKSKQVQSNPI